MQPIKKQMSKLYLILLISLSGLASNAQVTSVPEVFNHTQQTTNENNLNTSIFISPNPSSGIFTITFMNVKSKIEIEIFNDLGKRVVSTETNNSTTEIDLGKQGKGIYAAFFTDENKNVASRKLVVQ